MGVPCICGAFLFTGYFILVWNYTIGAIYKVYIFIDMDEPQYSEEQIEEMEDNYKIDDYFPRIRGNDIGWHHILMFLGGFLMLTPLFDKLESITWSSDPAFYIGLLILAIGFVRYYFTKDD